MTEDRRELAAWRRALMPFSIAIVAVVLAAFLALAYRQFDDLKASIQAPVEQQLIARMIDDFEQSHSVPPDHLRWKTEALIRDRDRRADLARANSMLLVSAWTRHIGFVTGMMMALIGATFILARLSDDGTSLDGKGGGVTAAVKTSSPGIVLAVLGTVLMMMAMNVRYREDGREQSIPFGSQAPAPKDIEQSVAGANTISDLDYPATNKAEAGEATK